MTLITVALLALCVGAYWATLPDFPPSAGVTRMPRRFVDVPALQPVNGLNAGRQALRLV